VEENGARKIVLENGLEFYGEGFGAPCDAIHEIVFNTSMVGYQEIISDPSYTGQMIVMTYPLIGNYGITDEDFESRLPALGGLIVREYSDDPSNFRWTKTLGEILRENGVPGVCGVDTRRITRIIRAEGSQKAMITSAGTPLGDALAALERYSLPRDLVRRVCSKTRWYSRTANPLFNVAAVDCGMKLNIVRSFNRLGCNVTVVPCDVTPGELEALRPDGLFISNGPGDPQDVPEVAELIRAMRGRMPIFGICLGCQLIGLAYGAKTYKMKFGHRGGNHPVVDLTTGRLEITSQNHSYAIDAASLEGTGLVMTHRNLLDDTAEGVTCLSDAVMAVQYHPESAPGPQDSGHLFERFISLMARARKR
jgi:carbamoyl-phosphate synthase small subunit